MGDAGYRKEPPTLALQAELAEEWQSRTWSEGEAAGQKSGLPEVPTLSLMRVGWQRKLPSLRL